MGLFDKLFGDNSNLNDLKKQFNDLEKTLKDAGIELNDNKKTNTAASSSSTSSSQPASKPVEVYDPLKDLLNTKQEKKDDSFDKPKSGVSWGEEMPDEENQFNFSGRPHEYFKKIYDENFAGKYRIESGFNTEYEGYLFTFYSLGKKVLVVELLKKKSGAKKLRRDTIDAGIAYLRYYTDVDGWWNTKSYVIDRTRKALEG